MQQQSWDYRYLLLVINIQIHSRLNNLIFHIIALILSIQIPLKIKFSFYIKTLCSPKISYIIELLMYRSYVCHQKYDSVHYIVYFSTVDRSLRQHITYILIRGKRFRFDFKRKFTEVVCYFFSVHLLGRWVIFMCLNANQFSNQ